MVMLTARVLLGSLFAVAALAKLADMGGARRAVEAFGVPRPFVALVGSAMIATEFSIAALLLAVPGSMGTRYGSVLALIVLMVFSTAVLVNLARGRRLECRCFGRLSSGPLGWSAIARNGCFATLAAFWRLAVVSLGPWRLSQSSCSACGSARRRLDAGPRGRGPPPRAWRCRTGPAIYRLWKVCG
jgi:Methylamine utilisation protein MauE